MNSTKEKHFNSKMDVHSYSQTPLLFLTFLQKRPLNSELQRELENLPCDVKLRAASSGLTDHIVYAQSHDFDSNIECDGELQADGHALQRIVLHDVPQVELVLPGPVDDVQAIREVAAELVRIADELDHIIVSQAAERLAKALSNSSQKNWWSYLSQGVDSLLKEVPGVHSERMVMALTFSLARAVCERAPRLLRDLCNTMMQYTINTTPC